MILTRKKAIDAAWRLTVQQSDAAGCTFAVDCGIAIGLQMAFTCEKYGGDSAALRRILYERLQGINRQIEAHGVQL